MALMIITDTICLPMSLYQNMLKSLYIPLTPPVAQSRPGRSTCIGATKYNTPQFRKQIEKTLTTMKRIRCELDVNLMILVSSMKRMRASRFYTTIMIESTCLMIQKIPNLLTNSACSLQMGLEVVFESKVTLYSWSLLAPYSASNLQKQGKAPVLEIRSIRFSLSS